MLKLMNVSKRYGHDVILKNVSVEFKEGVLYILKGENGAGKSTLLKLIAGVIYKTEGTLIRDGGVSYLPDKFRLPKMLGIRTFIEEIRDKNGKSTEELIEEYEVKGKRIGELSKGNLVKLGILYTFSKDADIYMMDEPLDGLDDSAKKILKEKIKDVLNKKHIVILSLHQKSFFNDLNPQIIEVKEGCISEKKKKSVSTSDSVSVSDLSKDE